MAERTELISQPEEAQAGVYRGAGQTAEIRQGIIRDVVRTHKNLLRSSRGKVDLSDAEAVRDVAERYMETCIAGGMIPSITGLASMLGFSRVAIYDHLRKHPESDTSQLLEQLRTSWAAARIACAERGGTSEAITIFLLKNSSLEFADRIEVQPVVTSPLDNLDSNEARKRLTEAIPDDD